MKLQNRRNYFKNFQDKKVVMGYLDKRITTAMPSSHGEDWQPLMLYRNSLMHGKANVKFEITVFPYLLFVEFRRRWAPNCNLKEAVCPEEESRRRWCWGRWRGRRPVNNLFWKKRVMDGYILAGLHKFENCTVPCKKSPAPFENLNMFIYVTACLI